MMRPEVPRTGLWQEIVRFDRALVRPLIGVRNAAGVVMPLIAGALLGRTASGLIVATGALNVAFSDTDLPYLVRARRMLAASLLVAIGVIGGALCGWHKPLIVASASAWAFAAGMLVAVDQTAADLGTISLVTLVVFAALPMSPENALLSGALAFGGGLLQTLISVLLWPLRRHTAQRRALAELFHGLAELAERRLGTPFEAPAGSAQSTQAQESLLALDRDYSMDAERYRALLSQGERIRLSVLALNRIRVRLERSGNAPETLVRLGRFLDGAVEFLRGIGDELADGVPRDTAARAEDARQLAQTLCEQPAELGAEGVKLINAIAGQFRAAKDLVEASGLELRAGASSRQDRWRPRRLRLQTVRGTLRANLSLQSAAFRHAVRLCVCVGIAETLGLWLGLTRSYWAPMTVAIVLKPDFTATFSRGVLRLGGTVVGLLLATGLFHAGLSRPGSEIALIALLTFAARGFGPANYGIAATAITGLVVLLVALNGTAPGPVIHWRGLNTLLGGAVSLVAYAAWPTWERTQVAEMFARLLDAYAAYFQAVRRAYERPQDPREWGLDARRLAGRRARSNAEASMMRLASEPGTSTETMRLWSGVLANSHRLANALMALEAALSTDASSPARPAFARLASDVEIVFHSMAASLRGSPLAVEDLPDLREDHNRLVREGDAGRYTLVNLEMDRVVNSLNTLALEVVMASQVVDSFR
jgi:uncharacterized membrane protein YccC